MNCNVTLTAEEMLVAGHVGLMRNLRAISKGFKHYSNEDLSSADSFNLHICAAMSEFAVAKALNLFWAPNIGEIRGGDVGHGLVEVRLRRIGSVGTDLATRPHDGDDTPYVLVIGSPPAFKLVGWLYGAEGKLGVWNSTRSVWFTPPEKLRGMDTLIPELRKRRARSDENVKIRVTA